ncbi:MAG TPA: hypothetical protein VHP37_14295 [Burkholderiales bacterium]|nr:hypothetical protein [Burkholderiales bacterium]
MSPTTPVCRSCRAPLDPLTQRRGVGYCDAAACRHKAADARTSLIRKALAAAAPAAAAAQLPHLSKPPAPVVWLKRWEPEIVETTREERDAHRAYLEAVVAENRTIDRGRLSPSTADDRHPQGARLCGQCRGRCCEHGGDWRAFLDITVLERWRAEAPERTFQDAVEAYLAMLPAAHVDGACLYQTTAGCAMPRERRAEICNGFACDALEAVQKAAASDPAAAVLAITFDRDRVDRAAVIERGATHPVDLEAQLPQRRITAQFPDS